MGWAEPANRSSQKERVRKAWPEARIKVKPMYHCRALFAELTQMAVKPNRMEMAVSMTEAPCLFSRSTANDQGCLFLRCCNMLHSA